MHAVPYVTLGSVAICSFLAATGVSHLVVAHFLMPAPLPTPFTTPAPPPPPTFSGQTLGDRNMFCSDCSTKKTRATPLPLRLIATHFSESGMSTALLERTDAARVGTFSIGEDVFVTGSVVAIAPTAVTIRTPLGDAVVRLDSHSRASAPAPETDAIGRGIQATGPMSWRLERTVLESKLRDTRALSRLARLVPAIRDGQPVGVRLYAIPPSSPLAQMGFLNGDTIRGVNGLSMATADAWLEAYSQLRQASVLSVDVLRRGKPVTLRYEIE